MIRWHLPTLVLSIATLAACSGENAGLDTTKLGNESGSSGSAGSTGSTGSGGSSGSSGSANAGTGNIMIDTGNMDAGTAGTGGGEACATDTLSAEVGPVNMFVMFDASGSMNENGKWPAATAAFASFFQDPASADLRIAFRFFGSNEPTVGCNNTACSIDACADPLVDIAPLTAASGAADPHETALVNLMQRSRAVGGFGTPIYPALGGAVKWASEHSAANPGENSVVLFVTDGEPNGCTEDIGAISALAADGWDQSGVRTYAIGLEGSNESQLDLIATAGNTTHGYFIGAGAAAEQDLLKALNEIRHNQIRCDIEIPAASSGPIDFGKVNVSYTPNSGDEAVSFGKVASADQCADLDGWHYDDPSAPKRIVLCSAACERVNAEPNAELSIELGCESRVADIR